MAFYRNFEDLPCWQHARKFCADAERIIESSKIARSFKLRDQMLGSSGSVMDNIAEGFDRRSKAEFARFLGYSKGSGSEFRSQLYRALDADRISESDFKSLMTQARSIDEELAKFIKTLGGYGT
jgi:four helix bundle protein